VITLRRFGSTEKLGVRYIVQMDPEDRTTHSSSMGTWCTGICLAWTQPGGGVLPFDTGSCWRAWMTSLATDKFSHTAALACPIIGPV